MSHKKPVIHRHVTDVDRPIAIAQQRTCIKRGQLLHFYNNHFKALLDLVWDYPGEPVPERSYQSGFTAARDSEWQWHLLGYMQICTSSQTDNHTSIPPLFFTCHMPLESPTNSIKALKAVDWLCITNTNVNEQIQKLTHTHNRFTALLESVRDHPGEQVPER